MKAALEAVIRQAANLWIEQTETDRAVLRAVQAGTIAELARYLAEAGMPEAAVLLGRINDG